MPSRRVGASGHQGLLWGVWIGLALAITGVPSALAQSLPRNLRWPVVDGTTPKRKIVLLSDPELRVGTAAGADPTLLSGVIGAVRLPEGTIAIGDANSQRVLFFDQQGAFLRSAGREGDGPGEYRLPRWFGKCRDGRLAVYDGAHNSMTFLSPAGEYLEVMAVPPFVNFDRAVSCAGPGHTIMLFNHVRHRVTPGQHLTVPAAVVRITGPAAVDTVASGGVQEYYVAQSIGASSEVPLGRAMLVAAGRSLLFTADNMDGLVTVYDSSGARRARFTLGITRHRMSRSHWDQAVRARISAEPLERSRKLLKAVLGELSPGPTLPLIDDIRADAADHLWVRTYDNYTTDLATWVVLELTGRPVAVAVSRRSLDIRDIGHDYLLGVSLDSDGVEQVFLHRFCRITEGQ